MMAMLIGVIIAFMIVRVVVVAAGVNFEEDFAPLQLLAMQLLHGPSSILSVFIHDNSTSNSRRE